MIILFIGPSGSGKDTQADLLRDSLGYTVISTGELLREEMAKGTKLGEEIKSYYDTGAWAPDETVYKLVGEFIGQNGAENFILTGAIRRESQIELLDQALGVIGDPIDLVVNFVLDENTAIERLSHRLINPETGDIYHEHLNPPPAGVKVIKRSDDTPEAIKKRLSEYNKYNDKIVEAYDSRGLLTNINASGTVEEIHSKIKSLIQDLET